MTSATLSTVRDQRTYFVSDERLRAFAQLTYAQRLQWVEQCSQFVRMAQQAKAQMGDSALQKNRYKSVSS
ncbi:MAG: hypothetical protein KGN32_07585 [Burkholderiales bacterium]|nr:hypothetical protein [Burkholderiales bacterium]